MANLVAGDIDDQFISRVVASDTSYLDRADLALYDLALSMGVEQADIEVTTLPFRVKEYLKAYVGWEVCWNNMGLSKKMLTQDGIQTDHYELKHSYYKKRLEALKSTITKEILTGDADTPEEYASFTSRIYRN